MLVDYKFREGEYGINSYGMLEFLISLIYYRIHVNFNLITLLFIRGFKKCKVIMIRRNFHKLLITAIFMFIMPMKLISLIQRLKTDKV